MHWGLLVKQQSSLGLFVSLYYGDSSNNTCRCGMLLNSGFGISVFARMISFTMFNYCIDLAKKVMFLLLNAGHD
jgi:hypothetical protein